MKCRCYINAKYNKTAWKTGKLPKPCPVEGHDTDLKGIEEVVMSNSKTTPRPWRVENKYLVYGNDELTRRTPPVAICNNTHGLGDAALEDEANARFIVTACNHFDEMYEELKNLLGILDARVVLEGGMQNDNPACSRARAILTKIKGA